MYARLATTGAILALAAGGAALAPRVTVGAQTPLCPSPTTAAVAATATALPATPTPAPGGAAAPGAPLPGTGDGGGGVAIPPGGALYSVDFQPACPDTAPPPAAPPPAEPAGQADQAVQQAARSPDPALPRAGTGSPHSSGGAPVLALAMAGAALLGAAATWLWRRG